MARDKGREPDYLMWQEAMRILEAARDNPDARKWPKGRTEEERRNMSERKRQALDALRLRRGTPEAEQSLGDMASVASALNHIENIWYGKDDASGAVKPHLVRERLQDIADRLAVIERLTAGTTVQFTMDGAGRAAFGRVEEAVIAALAREAVEKKRKGTNVGRLAYTDETVERQLAAEIKAMLTARRGEGKLEEAAGGIASMSERKSLTDRAEALLKPPSPDQHLRDLRGFIQEAHRSLDPDEVPLPRCGFLLASGCIELLAAYRPDAVPRTTKDLNNPLYFLHNLVCSLVPPPSDQRAKKARLKTEDDQDRADNDATGRDAVRYWDDVPKAIHHYRGETAIPAELFDGLNPSRKAARHAEEAALHFAEPAEPLPLPPMRRPGAKTTPPPAPVKKKTA